MHQPFVSIGLVTWNSAERLDSSIAALTQQSHTPLELIVIDNASTDGSAATVRARAPEARLVENATNLGYCGAHNQAISLATGDYYLALNPDVVMEPDYVAALVDALETHAVCGSAGGKLVQSRSAGQADTLDSTGLFVDRRRRQYLRGHGEADVGQYHTPGEVFGVDGAAPLYRRAMLESIRVGGQYFDEGFFAHKEDVDVAWRAQIAGWTCWYTPDAVALHPRSFRPGNRAPVSQAIRLHAVKNRYLLLARNESPAGWRRDGLRIIWYDLKIFAYLCLFERASLAAFHMVRRLWPRLMAWRSHIWSKAKASPEDLLLWFR